MFYASFLGYSAQVYVWAWPAPLAQLRVNRNKRWAWLKLGTVEISFYPDVPVVDTEWRTVH